MIAQLANLQQFFAAHLSDVLDWGKHVRPDPERKTTGDAAYVLIDTGLNRYKLSCLSSYVEPPAGAPYQCKALGTVTFDDFGGGKHIIAPRGDQTWTDISRHIHVRELTDGLAIARRELAEASPETVGAVRVRVAELVARAQKWGIEAKGLPAAGLLTPQQNAAQSLQWTPQELAALPQDKGVPIVTVADVRAGPGYGGDASLSRDKPFLGCPIIFITNPGESIAGMTDIIGWCVQVHSDETISAFVTPDHSEPMYRDKLHRRNPARNIRSNCWDFNERLMAPFRMAGEVDRLSEELKVEREKIAGLSARLDALEKQQTLEKPQTTAVAPTLPLKEPEKESASNPKRSARG
jgi:hypothetical protein